MHLVRASNQAVMYRVNLYFSEDPLEMVRYHYLMMMSTHNEMFYTGDVFPIKILFIVTSTVAHISQV